MSKTIMHYISMFPDFEFYGVEVKNKKFYGECRIEGDRVIIYFNTYLSKRKQIKAICHEAAHAEFELFSNEYTNLSANETKHVEKMVDTLTGYFMREYLPIHIKVRLLYGPLLAGIAACSYVV